MSQFPDEGAEQPQPASSPPAEPDTVPGPPPASASPGEPYVMPEPPPAPPPAEPYGMPESTPLATYPSAPPLAMTAPAGMYLDADSGLTLPEGVQLASHGRRIGAYFLGIPLFIVTLGIGYIVWGLIVWANGQTPALQVLGMRCWRTETRSVPGFWWMALREIVGGFVEGFLGIITQLVSFILFLTRPDRRCIHDLIAGTVVLYDPSKILASRPRESSSSLAPAA